MDREVDAMGYGICIFSADTVQDFLKREKIRKRKLLSLLQKDKELYLSTQKEGILIPLVGINAYNYAIRLEGRDEPVDDRWTQKIDYEKEEEFYTTPGQFEPVERYRSPWERWYKAETGKGELVKIYTDIKYDVPAGKYLLSIKGYVRKEKQKYPVPNCGFYLSLTKVEAFEGFKNPREADEYNFNIGSME